MTIAFPPSPSTGQVYQQWQWNGTAWVPYQLSSGAPIAVRVFTASGTYVPTTGMSSCIVECVGGGGGGAAPGAATSPNANIAAGGGSGGYSRKLLTAAQVGTSQAIVIGAGGTAANGAAGGNGGATTFGSTLCVANGGLGAATTTAPGAGAAAGTGDLAAPGAPGDGGATFNTSYALSRPSGSGGSSQFGGGGVGVYAGSSGIIGTAGQPNSGGGGSGGMTLVSTAYSGGPGGSGVCVVTEYAPLGAPAVAAAPQSGSRVLLSSQTVTTPVAAVAFTNLTNQYEDYEIEIRDFIPAAADSCCCQISQNNGSTWITTAGLYAMMYSQAALSGTAGSLLSGGSYAYWFVTSATIGVAALLMGHVKLYHPGLISNGGYKYAELRSAMTGSTSYFVNSGGSIVLPATPYTYNAVRFICGGGQNITSGTFKLYGIVP
jgi:hypothetical protein